MSEAYLFLLIFGIILCLVAIYLYFFKDPKQMFVCSRMKGQRGYNVKKEKTTTQQVACGVGGVGFALVLFFFVKLIFNLV